MRKFKDPKRDIQDFFWETIFTFYRMGLATQGETLDGVLFDDRGKHFWLKKNTYCRIFGKKLKHLPKEAVS
jgi:hypothetical protein